MEPLLKEFFASKNKGNQTDGSRTTQRSYFNKAIIDILKTKGAVSVIEKNYLDIVAFSIDAGHKIIALNLIKSISSRIGSQANYRDTKYYKAVGQFNNYHSYINNNEVNKDTANESLKDCSVYGYDSTSFKNKFKGRLRRQSRISGEKTWLPLYFLSKLYTDNNDNRFNEWIEDLYNNIYIILNIGGQNVHIKLYEIQYIGICRSGDVLALYQDKDENQNNVYNWYQVMTPSGYLNQKTEMKIFDDLKKIAIDHVTPIDRTLKTLKLPQLEKISKHIKQYKLDNPKDKGNTLESNAFKAFNGPVDLQKLKKELDRISADSYYRLMDGTINLQKSNVLEYTEFYTDGTHYYGFIADCKIYSSRTGVIYQDLDTSYIDVIDDTSWNSKGVKKIKIESVRIPIDKL